MINNEKGGCHYMWGGPSWHVSRAQKKRGSELERVGKSIQRVRTTKLQLRKLGLKEVQKLTVVTQLVRDRAGVQTQVASSKACTVSHSVRCLGPSLSIPPASSPRQWFLFPRVLKAEIYWSQICHHGFPVFIYFRLKLQPPDSQQTINPLVPQSQKLHRTRLTYALSCQAIPCLLDECIQN